MTDTSPSLPRGKPGAQTWDLLVDGVRHGLRLPPHTPRRPRYQCDRTGSAGCLRHVSKALGRRGMLMSGLQLFNATPALDWGSAPIRLITSCRSRTTAPMSTSEA